MAKSAEAVAWERRCQTLIDRIMVRLESAKREHKRGDHVREAQYRVQMLTMIGELNDLAANPPAGAKLPRLPKIT